MRVRVKGRMMAGFMCSCITEFPKSESLWRILHNHIIDHNYKDMADTPELLKRERECILEVNNAIKMFPIEMEVDYHHLVEAFDMLRHLAHIYPFDFIENPNGQDWKKVNPWRLPRGKSQLIDYWWDVPEKEREFGHMILNKLASDNIRSIEDLIRLREEVERGILLKADDFNLVKEYFEIPYHGEFFIYDKRVSVEQLKTQSFHEILNDGIARQIYDTILSQIELKGKRVLDLGCSIGHFSFLCAERGATVTGVEMLERKVQVANAIAKIRGIKNVDFICSKIQDYLDRSNVGYDLTLMLNMFDYVIMDNEKIAHKVLKQVSDRSEYMAAMMALEDSTYILTHSNYGCSRFLLDNSYAGRQLILYH